MWLYREQLSQAGVIEALFDDFDGYLKTQGYQAMGRSSMRRLLRFPNSESSGETPKEWAEKAARRRQKDTDARWTKKPATMATHLNIDRRHKLIRRYSVTDASVHDSQAVDDLLTTDNTASGVWADSAYRSKDIEEKMKEKGLTSLHRKACRNRPLRDWEKAGNRSRSRFRAG